MLLLSNKMPYKNCMLMENVYRSYYWNRKKICFAKLMQILIGGPVFGIAQSVLGSRLGALFQRNIFGCLFSATSRPVLDSNQAYIKRLQCFLPCGCSYWEGKLITNLQLFLRLRMSGVLPLLPRMSSCCE